jgi:hypothetical protein
MQVIISAAGDAHCVYGEEIDLPALGLLSIRRGSHVEPDDAGNWICDLTPVGGPLIGPFSTRGQALSAEVVWLETHWLVGIAGSRTATQNPCRAIS